MTKNFTKNQIEDAITNSTSAAEASRLLNVQYKTYRRWAKLYGVWKTNQSGKGKTKKNKSIPLSDILYKNVIYTSSYHLKNRLIAEGVFENKCSVCGITDWLGEKLSVELDHIDGNRNNNYMTNLRLLCPNCHSQTPTFRSKKRL